MSEIQIAELWSYPIKSCGGVRLEQARVGQAGFELDREYMLVDEAGAFLTQRRCPELAQVGVVIETDHLQVTIAGFGETQIDTAYNADLPTVETQVHSRAVIGLDQGSAAADIFCQLLNREVRLLRASRENLRYIPAPYRRELATNRVLFGDAFPFLLTSRASLHALHRQQNLQYGTVPMNRFRPNIVVDGPDLKAFEEDGWKHIRSKQFGAFIVRACDRCKIPSVIQTGIAAGEVGDIAVKATFLKARAGVDLASPALQPGRFFGQNLNPDLSSVGKIARVGSSVLVTDRGASNIRLSAQGA